ncbi:MAG: NADPH-dependent FMN reductase [Pirellulales bacterium]
MVTAPKILAFAGSARRASFNKQLVRIAANGALAAGGEVTLVDFRDYPLPLFDQDDEAERGMPEQALRFKELMLSHQGFLISAPEYNSSITPLLKNAIDWASRPVPNEPSLACFTGKVAVLMSASPGALGGLRGLVHVRAILGNIGTLVLPATISIPKAMDAFAEDGSLRDSGKQAAVAQLGAELVSFLQKHLA